MTISIAEWRYQSFNKLSKISESADIEINSLLCQILNRDLAWCLTNSDRYLSQNQLEQLNLSLESLLAGIPLAYVLGGIDFFGHFFVVNKEVLIPRPETELMVETAINWLNDHHNASHIVDVGCGSGIIILSILKKFPSLEGMALDISRGALLITRRNQNIHNIDHLYLVQSDLLAGIKKKFDLIVANLPYIPSSNLLTLKVSEHEPKIALDGGKDGLETIRRLIKQIPSRINSPGLVLLEIQYDQSYSVQQEIKNHFPLSKISILKDYSGHDRVVKVEV